MKFGQRSADPSNNNKTRDPNFIDPEKQRKLLWIEKVDWRKTIPFVVFAMALYYMRK